MVKGENHARKCAQSKRYSVGPRGDPRACITAAVVQLMPKLSPAWVCQCELISGSSLSQSSAGGHGSHITRVWQHPRHLWVQFLVSLLGWLRDLGQFSEMRASCKRVIIVRAVCSAVSVLCSRSPEAHVR